MKKKCALAECGSTIPKSRHGNATTCCKAHALELKKINEKKSYQKIKSKTSGIKKESNERFSISNMLIQEQFPFSSFIENTKTVDISTSSNKISNPPYGTTYTGTYTTSTHNLYSTPELIKAVIKDNSIELIYKRQYMVSNNWGMPHPEVYKDIYSRNGGDVRREIGTYVPYQEESYIFDSDLI